MSVRFQPNPQTRDRARDSGDDWHFRLCFWALRKLSRQPGHVMLLSNNPSETCGLRLLNNSHGCIGGRTMTKGARVAAPVRSAHPHDLKMRFFYFMQRTKKRVLNVMGWSLWGLQRMNVIPWLICVSSLSGVILFQSSENNSNTWLLCYFAIYYSADLSILSVVTHNSDFLFWHPYISFIVSFLSIWKYIKAVREGRRFSFDSFSHLVCLT